MQPILTDTAATVPTYLEEDTDKAVRFDLGLVDGLLRPMVEAEIRETFKREGIDTTAQVPADPDDAEAGTVPGWFMDRRCRMYFYAVWCRYGLRGWAGLTDKSGAEVKYREVEVAVPMVGKRRLADPELLGGLRPEWIEELGAKAFNLNNLTPDRERSF